mmetsp:Transcript_42840/g.48678  ORF Transcript_42840/g.48678 Transcript_42840/m.48678 type:complete len:116 (+) Transcript_42840:231-578(+)|eukprot:CAMPEP_0194181924 /NCGR_PEP_ID=MMETSP0154-20130528/22047_1 /TAXON_ID=1049557 /ORGANISM="Thalassiothrix antarctica, Strain L6-D1" /LENGTH=115 /DNA_ID=CAMNT_0038898039 /DNA_START=159 /DNA_END=506 /DNA_ORIENTATION=+
MAEQPDGSYPRINGKMLSSCQHTNKIVSLVGRIQKFDGNSIQFTCADNMIANVHCEPDADVLQGSVYELVGLANDDGTLQLFVTRKLTDDMDMENYNRLITDVQSNPKFAGYFAS